MTTDDPAEQICRRMAELRRELSGDVREVTRSARAMADWSFYVRRFPWASMAVAGAIGFLLVPKRREVVSPDAAALAEMAKHKQLFLQTRPPTAKESQGLFRGMAAMAAAWAVRQGMEYIGHRLRAAHVNGEPPTTRGATPRPLHQP